MENWLEESIINAQFPEIAVFDIGLTPMSPLIWVVPVDEIPDLARIAKLAAEPRLTGN